MFGSTHKSEIFLKEFFGSVIIFLFPTPRSAAPVAVAAENVASAHPVAAVVANAAVEDGPGVRSATAAAFPIGSTGEQRENDAQKGKIIRNSHFIFR